MVIEWARRNADSVDQDIRISESIAITLGMRHHSLLGHRTTRSVPVLEQGRGAHFAIPAYQAIMTACIPV